MEGEPGYNAHTDEFVDMISAGIVDPAKVIKQDRISKYQNKRDTFFSLFI